MIIKLYILILEIFGLGLFWLLEFILGFVYMKFRKLGGVIFGLIKMDFVL